MKGDQIPLTARIFVVVDVWDALRSERPYREPWPEEQVRTYLKQQSGKHFDSKVVDAFLNLLGILFSKEESNLGTNVRTTGFPHRIFKV